MAGGEPELLLASPVPKLGAQKQVMRLTKALFCMWSLIYPERLLDREAKQLQISKTILELKDSYNYEKRVKLGGRS